MRRGVGARSPAVGTGLLIAVMLTTALLLLGLVVPGLRPPAGELPVPMLLLAGAFALTEAVALHLRPRGREVHSYTFSELPLVVGLASLAPGALLVARLVGSGAYLVATGQRGIKLVFNLAQYAGEVALAILVYRAILSGHPVDSGRGALAALAAVAASELWAVIAVTSVVVLHQGRSGQALTLVAMAPLLSTAVNTGIALVLVAAVARDPRTGLALLLLAALVVLGIRSYNGLASRHDRLQQLHGASEALSASLSNEDPAATVLDQAAHLLRARRVELHLDAPDQLNRARLDGQDRPPLDVGAGRTWWEAPGRTGLLVTRGDRGRVARQLQADGLTDGVAVEIGDGVSLRGVLLVADRVDAATTFDLDDVAMLSTLAAQAATTLANSRLLERWREEAAQRLHDSHHDPRTGLPNRRGYAAAVHEAFCRGRVGVLLLDLDDFKDVNDVFGHPAGDVLLRLVADRIVGCLPPRAIAAHLGGDELAVVLPAATEEEIAALVEAVQGAFLEPFLLVGDRTHISASIGVVSGPADGSTPELLLQRADLAMYAAKARGGGSVEVYGTDLEQANRRRLQVVRELRQSLDHEAIDVVFQPQLDLCSGELVVAEALARWTSPTLGPVGPDEFIPLAEQAGLIGRLMELVLSQALAAAAGWARQGTPIGVAVNLSARSLHDPDLVQTVTRQLDRHAVPPDRLTLEVTETAVMDDVEQGVQALARLGALGVRLSMDDFGTGHSSLAYLKTLPVHEVKIDQSFVLALTRDPRDEALVRGAVGLAHDLGLCVVAEGVEDEQTLSALRGLACDVAQGYWISRPVSCAVLGQQLVVGTRFDVPRPRAAPVLA